MAEALKGAQVLTPKQRFRQLDPSWFFNGQTTSLLTSDAENELVREDLGGIVRRMKGPKAGR